MNNNFLIIGDDEYIRESELSKIRDKFLSPSEKELNYSIHNPDDAEGVMNSLETMPFLADNRVVYVRGAEDISGDLSEAIVSYLEKPSSTGILIMTAGKAFKKSKYYRKLSGAMEVIKAEKPDIATMKSWVSGFFRKENIKITPQAVELIVELKGNDTRLVKEELDKIASFSGGEEISAADVEMLVGRSVTETVFKLVDAINEHDGKWTFQVLADLYDQKKQPPEIIGYLSWYIRIMQKITTLTTKGLGVNAVAKELGYSPWYTKKLFSQAKRYSIKRISNWTTLLLETDHDIKRGKKQPQLAMEMLLVGLLKK